MEKQIAWLKRVAASLANIESDQLINMELECPKIDETSMYFDIEDILNDLKEEEHATNRKTYVVTVAQSVFSMIVLVIAVVLLVAGVSKIKKQLRLRLMEKPFSYQTSVKYCIPYH